MFTIDPQPDDIPTTPSTSEIMNIAVDPKPIVDHLRKKGNESLLNLFQKCSMLVFLTEQRKNIIALKQQGDPDQKIALYFEDNRNVYLKKIRNLRKCVIREEKLLY